MPKVGAEVAGGRRRRAAHLPQSVGSHPDILLCAWCANKPYPFTHIHPHAITRKQGRLDAAAAAATAAFHVCPNLQLLADAMRAHPFEEWEARCPLTPGQHCAPCCSADLLRNPGGGSLPNRSAVLETCVAAAGSAADPGDRLSTLNYRFPHHCVQAGVPVKPMLAKICEGLPDALRQLAGAPFLGMLRVCAACLSAHLGFPGALHRLAGAMNVSVIGSGVAA